MKSNLLSKHSSLLMRIKFILSRNLLHQAVRVIHLQLTSNQLYTDLSSSLKSLKLRLLSLRVTKIHKLNCKYQSSKLKSLKLQIKSNKLFKIYWVRFHKSQIKPPLLQIFQLMNCLAINRSISRNQVSHKQIFNTKLTLHFKLQEILRPSYRQMITNRSLLEEVEKSFRQE